jgi:myo-inositol 2-dehydrogenase/D-chiro-inositol 1-dehydrogenase
MGPETLHFLESVLLDRDPLVSAEHARMVMESYLAADISAEIGEPVDLPLSNHAMATLADMNTAKKLESS